jgi:hypothetical protein
MYFFFLVQYVAVALVRTDIYFKPVAGSRVIHVLYQRHFCKVDPSATKLPGSGTEVMPVKDPHTRINSCCDFPLGVHCT